jgi:hypothetical protein
MTTMTYTETLTVVHCTCGMAFAIPDALYHQAQKSSRVSVFCPKGHSFHYTETLEVKLQRERDRSARLAAERDQIQASLTAQKGVATKLRKKVERAEHGVCPHCNRSFVNLQRHVKTKHPECLA